LHGIPRFGGSDHDPYDAQDGDFVKTTSPLARVTETLLLTAFLVLVLAIAVQGAFQTRAQIADTFNRQSAIGQAQIMLEELLRLQIVEEDSLRGYVLTKDPFYVDQYHAAVLDFDDKLATIRATIAAQQVPVVQSALAQYASYQDGWRRHIASQVLQRPDALVSDLDKRSKVYSDYETRAATLVRSELADRNRALAASTQEQIDESAYVRAFFLLLFGLLAILFNAYRSRAYRELEEEKYTTQILQRAFRSEVVPLPNCRVGGAYLSASSHLAVGGDVFDVYRLSNRLALLIIADVSGKGVDAAVLTAFIKFTIRGIALRRRDPNAILAEFNTAFSQTVENPYLFVSMFVGILDTDTYVLRYASAGHDSAFVRRSTGVQQLAVTGPVLGVMEEPFGDRMLNLEPGDTLVLATDGLTEARRDSGEQLREQGAMRLIAAAAVEPQALCDELVAQVRAIGGNHLRDDLAILAIQIAPSEASHA